VLVKILRQNFLIHVWKNEKSSNDNKIMEKEKFYFHPKHVYHNSTPENAIEYYNKGKLRSCHERNLR
jgi:hypothetical protein